MSTWIVGDVHGCGESFAALRARIQFQPNTDHLIFVGDLVNRGPTSLETLRWIVEHEHCVTTVLGNHDLHLLWCALGAGMPRGRDTIAEIINAPDADALIDWLRRQPLAAMHNGALIVHAGIHPAWTVEEALSWSEVLSERLQGPDAGRFLNRMRGGLHQEDEDAAEFYALDVLTRMRTLHRGTRTLCYSYSGTLREVPRNLKAWFRARSPHARPAQVFFGHWAALGFHVEAPYICVDSGCVWGRGLTAWELETGTRIFQPAIDAPT